MYKHGNSKEQWYLNTIGQNYRAKKLNQTPILTELEKAKIELYYRVSQQLGSEWHVDHIVPISKGGLHHPDNLQITTIEYNLAKSNKLLIIAISSTSHISLKLLLILLSVCVCNDTLSDLT